ncbi:MAG: sugar transferase [bacterium]|nr:sugar transferase [bacterium]
MTVLSRSVYVLAIVDAIIITLTSIIGYALIVPTVGILLAFTLPFIIISMIIYGLKDLYKIRKYSFKDIFILFEIVFIASFIAGTPAIIFYGLYGISMILFDIIFIYLGLLVSRIIYLTYKKFFKPVKNVLIVGAGQDGKLIAEEIQERPELGMRVVGFLDDNMNNIEEEDSSIPILGLTYDSEAVIKDNNVDIVIIAVKARMDGNILSDLAKGIPLGVQVWRMPTFYAHITHKLFTSKMAVNWLFYDFVRPKYIMYSHIKRVLDVISAITIMLITLPITLIAVIGIKLSDFGPIFYTQTRIGKFGKPFRMVKFRTMYQDKVDQTFDDDLEDISKNDKRIMPFCRWIRKLHIDDIPQMINILKGEMSLIGPRPVREEVDYKHEGTIPFWECRRWVRPGFTGWQQICSIDCIPEERLGYDLYYIKNRTLMWEIAIFLRYILKLLSGKL